MSSLKVHLTVVGSFKVDDLTRVLNLETTAIKTKGDPIDTRSDINPNPPQMKNDLWRFSLEGQEDKTLEKLVNEIIDIFTDRKDRLLQFVSEHGLDFGLKCVIYMEEDDTFPELTLERETIKKMASLNLYFEVDVY